MNDLFRGLEAGLVMGAALIGLAGAVVGAAAVGLVWWLS